MTESPDASSTDAAPEPSSAFAHEEVGLLADALGIAPSRILPQTREPLGRGSVAGLDVLDDEGRVFRYYVDTSRLPVVAETGLALADDGGGAADAGSAASTPSVSAASAPSVTTASAAGDEPPTSAAPPAAPAARIWQHPADPHLPALAPTAFGDTAAALLARLGEQADGQPVLIGYRPGRRAVLRVPTTTGAAWVKVVRPSRVGRIVRAHAALADAGIPVPPVRGWSPEGLVVIADASGIPVADVVWDPARLLDAVDAVRALFEAAPPSERARSSVADRIGWYVDRLVAIAPHERRRFQRLGARIASAPASPIEVMIHGDLHFGQLFTDPGGTMITGVIDVDTAGVGDPADDSAAFIAHAVASAALTPEDRAERVWRLAELALDRWGDDRARALAAAHLMGHAIGAAEGGDTARARRLIDAGEAVLDRESPRMKMPKNM